MSVSSALGSALDYALVHHDLIPTSELIAAGLDRNQIRQLCRDGVLERVIRGLYRCRGSRSPLQDIAAAVSRHTGAAGSHTSALFVHGLDVTPPRSPFFTMPPEQSTGNTRLGTLHRSPLDSVDVTVRQRIPVTTIARSIVDSAEQLSVAELAAVLNEAVTRRLVTIRMIEECAYRLEAAPGRVGSGRLRAALAPWTDEIKPDSIAEAAAIRRIVEFGLPAPVTQHVIEDGDGEFVGRVDMAWPEQMVLREYDSDRYHGPDKIELDEIRRQKFGPLGWRVGGLRRQDLHPSELDWLRKLRRDLRAGAASIAS